MKKTILPVIAIAAFMAFTISSCTKEQTFLNLLYGTWHLDSELDEDGIPVVITSPIVVSSDLIYTFFACNDKEEENCHGSYKSTTTYTASSGFTPSISAGDFSFRVFGKTQLLLDGDYWEVESIDKKTLSIHPAEKPRATHTFSKQK